MMSEKGNLRRRAIDDGEGQLSDVGNEINSGPIRRRIDSFTIQMEPFSTELTDEEAANARNAIESIIQNYFFEVQPWAITTENGSSNDLEGDDDYGTSYKASITDRNRDGVDGSVTYVGLAQILEKKQIQGGVELTMNGLVYFAEGSTNIPDETELLQAMEQDALGDPTVVIEALKDYFPSLQLVTVGNRKAVTGYPTVSPPDVELPIETILTTTLPPQQTPNQVANQVIAVTEEETQGDSLNSAAIAGGVGAALVALVVILGLFTIQRRRNGGGKNRRGKPAGDEYLVAVENAENGFGDDWKVNSNTTASSFHEDGILPPTSPTNSETSENGEQKSPLSSNIEESSSKPTFTRERSSSNTLSYITSLFQKPTSSSVEQHQEISSVSSYERTNEHLGGKSGNKAIVDDFDGEGTVTDFDDVVSIQPHILPLQPVESFEEQHKGMTRQDCVVQKDQLGSLFERRISVAAPKLLMTNMATGASTGSNLSYSSSSMSSREQHYSFKSKTARASDSIPETFTVGNNNNHHQHNRMDDEREDQRVRYSMMPNPYFRRSYATPTTKDRSTHCVLTATEITAASLAQRRKGGSDAGSGTSLGMIPKVSTPTWWSSSSTGSTNTQGRAMNKRKSLGSQKDGSRSSSAAAAAATSAYSDNDDDLAYSGDEENTFGVAESDGWDPADTELSSMGDPPTQEDMNMVSFHPKVDDSNNAPTVGREKPPKLHRKRPPLSAAALSTRFQNPNHYALDGNISDTSSEDENDILRYDPSSMEI